MQRQQALFEQASIAGIQSQVIAELPGEGASVEIEAVNDDYYHDRFLSVRMVLSVLGNVIGGALLLFGMFMLPQLVALFLG